MHNPFRYFNSSPEVIRLVVMMYIRYLILFLKDVPPVAERVGANPIQLRFTYVMVAVDANSQQPAFFVSLEQSSAGSGFLCTLDQHGNHSNLGSDERLLNEGEFVSKANSLIKRELQVDHIDEVKR